MASAGCLFWGIDATAVLAFSMWIAKNPTLPWSEFRPEYKVLDETPVEPQAKR
jgi:hypothetical protein